MGFITVTRKGSNDEVRVNIAHIVYYANSSISLISGAAFNVNETYHQIAEMVAIEQNRSTNRLIDAINGIKLVVENKQPVEIQQVQTTVDESEPIVEVAHVVDIPPSEELDVVQVEKKVKGYGRKAKVEEGVKE